MRVLLLLVFFSGGWFAQAQITFTSADFQKVDTLDEGYHRSNFTGSVLRESGFSWDYSRLKSLSPRTFLFDPGKDSISFWKRDFEEPLNGQANLFYDLGYQIDTSGFKTKAIRYQEYRLSLALITGQANDELFLPYQVSPFQTYELKFPAKYGDGLLQETQRSLKFLLTLANEGLNQAQGEIISYFFIEDSISGDGVLRLPKGDGNGFASDEVLQVKRQVQRIDSFFVDGQAASQSLLTFFGITQGRISAESTVSFWRKNHKISAARFFYNDATYNAISHAEFSARGEFPMGMIELEPGNKMEIFPNPSQGRININSKDAFRVDVYDLQGRMLSTIPISQGGMDCGLNSGIYMMKIYNQKGEVLSIQKIQIIP